MRERIRGRLQREKVEQRKDQEMGALEEDIRGQHWEKDEGPRVGQKRSGGGQMGVKKRKCLLRCLFSSERL